MHSSFKQYWFAKQLSVLLILLPDRHVRFVQPVPVHVSPILRQSIQRTKIKQLMHNEMLNYVNKCIIHSNLIFNISVTLILFAKSVE
jgi:hypothetical protein